MTLVVAEISANHRGSLQLALETIEAAAESGADAIKLQTYSPNSITLDCNSDLFTVRGGTKWDGRSLFDLYSEGFTPREWHSELFSKAQDLGMMAFSSPFDLDAVDFLQTLAVPAFKVASFEITDVPLIERMAATRKPIIISTGIASEREIRQAINACVGQSNTDVILLKCTSSYPAEFRDANLVTILDMGVRFGVPVGYSDHTEGNLGALTAVALGAVMLEKHFILDRGLGGPDASFSAEPDQFASLVTQVRDVEVLRGTSTYALGEQALVNRQFARSLFVVADVHENDVVTCDNVRSIRPNAGLDPARLPTVLGKRFTRSVKRGTPLSEDMLSLGGEL
jgi:pseudaminic acid synthase